MSIVRRYIFTALVLLTAVNLACSARAQRDLKDIPVPDAELERQTFRLPEGFEVNLYAADPLIAKPTQMNFDESGRLWVVSSEVYPHIEPGAAATDRVIVLEDRDGDGTSDRTHVFAEGLLIPTGIAPGDGGAYVANSTELLHFADADNDLKADSRRIVLSGFGTEDTHHILHTLRWGPDGFLYFNQSIYIHSHIETPWGVRRLNAGGIWQFRPESLELGVFMRGLVNSWGHHFDRYGQSFATDGAGGEGINYIVPGAYYFTAADAPQILHGLNPGSPKHCGLEIVETPMLPPDWQGSAITNDFRGHRVCRFTLSDDRSGYVSREQPEVIWSDHGAFRPIDVKLGPDGAIYIADWYNPIIQHGEVDFRDPRRDHTHGRIWRVRWTGAPQQPDSISVTSPNDRLFEELRSPDKFRREATKRILRQRGSGVADDLTTWLEAVDVTPLTEHLRLEALWCFQAARRVNSDLLHQLLDAEDGRVRAAAVRVLSHWKFHVPRAGRLLADLVNDSHPRVRLEAVRALSFSPLDASEKLKTDLTSTTADTDEDLLMSPLRIEAAMTALDYATDPFLDYAIWLTARELSSEWLPAFRDGHVDFGNNLQHLVKAFAAVGQGAPIQLLVSKLYDESVTTDQRKQLSALIGETGAEQHIAEMVRHAAENSDTSTLRTALTETRKRNLRVSLSEQQRAAWDAVTAPGVRGLLMAFHGQWRLSNFQSSLTSVAADPDQHMAVRMGACEGIALSGETQLFDVLSATIRNSDNPILLRKHAAALLTGVAPGRGARLAADLLQKMNPEDGPQDLVRTFLTLKNGEQLLNESLVDGKLRPDVAREILRVVRESGRAAPELEATLRTIGQIVGRRTMSAEERSQLLQLAMSSASAAEGERIFRNPKLACLKCHAIGGAGGRVGPDMISLGGSAQPDYLLESLLNPNAKVKENYHTVVIATTAGKIVSGVQVQQSTEAVTVRDAEDNLVVVPREDIEELGQGVSLMPEGQVDTLTDVELAALVRFMSELGRTEDYTIGRRRLARTWDVLQATPEAAFRLRRVSYALAAEDDDAFQWSRAYSTVSGSLPIDDIPAVSVKNRSAAGSRGVGFARAYLKVNTSGTVMLNLNSTRGVEMRLNSDPVDIAESMSIQLNPGTYRLTLTIDRTQRSQPIELELADTGTAVAEFVN